MAAASAPHAAVRAPTRRESRRALLQRSSSAVVLPGFGVLRSAIEGVVDRIEQSQATAWRVPLHLPCVGRDEFPIFTLVLMVLSCAVIWGMMLTTIYLHIGPLSELEAMGDVSAGAGGRGGLAAASGARVARGAGQQR